MKKRRHREWYIAAFDDGIKEISKRGAFPDNIIAFDTFNDAYNYAASMRLSPIRDGNGELVLDKDGKGTLPKLGKITVFVIKGKNIDWKRTAQMTNYFKLRGLPEMSEVIQLQYEFPYRKHMIAQVLEETKEAYEKATFKEQVDDNTPDQGQVPTAQ